MGRLPLHVARSAPAAEVLPARIDRLLALNVERAAAQGGCGIVVMLLALVTVGVAALALSSVATPILASLLILGGLGLVVMAWAERGTLFQSCAILDATENLPHAWTARGRASASIRFGAAARCPL